ncbi:MAG: hypothetical protein MJA83_20690 [Gammaproteobacteria bacterium]|nr:hypothetical protein [Gammaproteobacteria bacterium]
MPAHMPAADDIFEHPEFYPVALDGDKLVFVRMSRQTFRQSIFLDPPRIRTSGQNMWAIPVEEIAGRLDATHSARPLLYIFHIAHCGSTLLARALDFYDGNTVYREPFALRQLASEFAQDVSSATAEGAGWRRDLALVMSLLARSQDAGKPNLIKANVPVNFILPELMALNGQSKGILLYTGLRDYLLAVLKTEQHRQWVRNVSLELATVIKRTTALLDVDVTALAIPEAAACLWLSQMINFTELLQTRQTFRSLDSEQFFAEPAAVLQAANEFLALNINESDIQDIVKGELFAHHAKRPGETYDNDKRILERKQLAERLEPDVKQALDWAEPFMTDDVVSSSLPGALLG